MLLAPCPGQPAMTRHPNETVADVRSELTIAGPPRTGSEAP
jgi:hypothetical protein